MQCCCHDREPWEAIEALLDVSGQPAQTHLLVIGLLNAGNKHPPELSCLVLFPVPIDISMAPVVGMGQQGPCLDGTENPIDHGKNGYRPVVLGLACPFPFGQRGHTAGHNLFRPPPILPCPAIDVTKALQHIGIHLE